MGTYRRASAVCERARGCLDVFGAGRARRYTPAVLSRRLGAMLAPLMVCVVLIPGAASSSTFPQLHECQKPVRTGVEVYGLRSVSTSRSCSLALALFKWEYVDDHAAVLYGCHRVNSETAGYPYLKLHSFHRWKLSLAGKEQLFTMSRGRSSFHVTGTDFPLNCT
jgi:hypothetical protein